MNNTPGKREPQKTERYCDMVMKGGITSGVVYPQAIANLSDEFELRNVGGTSAGAIAAAAAAAAAVGRRRGNPDAFDKLRTLPQFLQRKHGQTGQTNLFMFFQPQPQTRRVFSVAAAALSARSKLGAFTALALAAARYFPFAFLLGGAPGMGLCWLALQSPEGALRVATLIVGALIAVAGLVFTPLAWFAFRFLRRVPENYFGLCTGMPADGKSTSVAPDPEQDGNALTVWLTSYLNQAAGQAPTGTPLTFGQLWDPIAPAGTRPPKGHNDVRLEMLTTCLTWRRPFRLPFRDDDDVKENRFYFKLDEFQKLFPAAVVDWMQAHPRDSSLDEKWRQQGYVPMPDPWNLPVVVATRMSLSFPVLLSAVPLYAYDQRVSAQERQQHPPRRCWFSDGGICSNFPMHFFDSPLPRWPTFGINLVDKAENTPAEELETPWMPQDNNDGIQEIWQEIDTKSGVFGFIGTVIQTMQNWSDNSLLRLPGYRDRIAHVGLTPEEGGLNLNMKDSQIAALGKRGANAADEFVRRFAHGEHDTMTWENHRWLRMRSTLASMEELLDRMELGCSQPLPGDIDYETMIADTALGDEPSYHWRNERQRKRALQALRELRQTLKHWREAEVTPATEGAPRPRPEFRPRPRV